MPDYNYIAKDKSGKTVSGTRFASSENALIAELDREGLIILGVELAGNAEKSKGKSFFSLSLSFGGKKGGKVKTFELIILCRQLATMLKGGVPILNAVQSISMEIKNQRFKQVLANAIKDLQSGEKLSESFKKYPDVFSVLIVTMVEAGEKVGSLDEMLMRMALYLESKERLSRKIRSAAMYPAFIAGFFLFAIAGVTLFLIPRFKDVYEGFGAKLPTFTLIVFGISDFMVQNILFILIFLIVVIGGLMRYVKCTKRGRERFDRSMLKLPLFGDVITKAAISKFCKTLSTLLSQGISVTEALRLVGKTAGNVIIENASNAASSLVTDGETISAALTRTGIFPSLMLQMVSVGVESGSLPDLLDKTADFYEEQVDTFVGNLTTMIEPIMIVSLGLVVGVVVIALYLPIFGLSTAVSAGGGH